jgi:hypothetical protein
VHYPSYPRKLKKPLKTEEIHHHRGTEDTKDAVIPKLRACGVARTV